MEGPMEGSAKGPMEGSAKGPMEGRLRRRRPCKAPCIASRLFG
jgi:hypothetical protein